MFEVGKLVARISLEGAQAFGRDLGKVRDEWKGLSDDGRQAATEVGRAGLGIGAAITAAVGITIAKSAQFEKAMSAAGVATGATGAELGKLRDAALEAGGKTVFTAEEAAAAIENLGKAGVGTADIYGGALAGSLALAAAGEVDVAFAADVAATAMNQFKLQGRDVPHIADLLAAAAGKAQGDVTDMSFALKQSGLVASQFGLSLEDTTGTLAAFAANGLIGSDAGTSFRTMLLSLAKPSEQAKDELAKWNIQAYDAQGNFVGITSLAGQLEKGLAGATQAQRDQALATIFGTDAIRAANVLYQEGSTGLAEWISKVDDSGYAAKVAAERQNNLAGDLEKLGGAFDTLMIKMGSGAQGPLRDLVQGITGVVDAFAQLPEPVQGGVLAAGALLGGLALLGGGLLVIVPKVAEFRTAITTLGNEMPRTKAAAEALHGPLGIGLSAALAVGVAAMAIWIQRQADVAATATLVKDSLDESTGAFTDYTEELVAKQLAEKDAFGIAAELGISQRELTQAVLEGGDALDDVQDRLSARNNFVDFFNGSGIAAGNANRAITDLREGIERAGQQYEDESAAIGENTAATDTNRGSTEAATGAYGDAAGAVDGLTTEVDQLTESVMKANGIGQDAVTANVNYQEALAKTEEHIANVHAGVEGYSFGLDDNTAAGRANIDMLVEEARKSQEAAQATFDLDGDQAGLTARLETGRQKLYDHAYALSNDAAKAQELTDKIYGIPASRTFTAYTNTGPARSDLESLLAAYQNRSISLRAYINKVEGNADGGIGFYANGGLTIESYAGGGGRGMREQHVAQIANAGAWRMWAEPETGGEAYIPLSSSKRARSTQLLEQVASMFGYDLTRRADARAAANTPDATKMTKGGGTQQVTEIVQLVLPDGRVLHEIQRQYERSIG